MVPATSPFTPTRSVGKPATTAFRRILISSHPTQQSRRAPRFRNAEWLGRISLLHAFAQNQIAPIGETPTGGYNLLKAEISHTRELKNDPTGIKRITVGLVGNNLLNDDIRNHVSYTKDQVLMPGSGVRAFATLKY